MRCFLAIICAFLAAVAVAQQGGAEPRRRAAEKDEPKPDRVFEAPAGAAERRERYKDKSPEELRELWLTMFLEKDPDLRAWDVRMLSGNLTTTFDKYTELEAKAVEKQREDVAAYAQAMKTWYGKQLEILQQWLTADAEQRRLARNPQIEDRTAKHSALVRQKDRLRHAFRQLREEEPAKPSRRRR